MTLLRTLAATGTFTLALMSGTSAHALDANAFAAKVSETLALSGNAVTIGSAVADGDTVTLSDWQYTLQGTGEAFDIDGAITFTGVAETSEGGYTAEAATIDDIEIAEDDIVLKVTGVKAENIAIPATPADDPVAAMQLYEKVSAGPITVHMANAEMFAIDSLVATTSYDEGANRFTSGYDVTGIRADLENFPDPEAAAMASVFGIAQLEGEAVGRSEWTLDDGHLIVSEGSFTFANIGRLNLTFDMTGYTLDVIEQLQAMNAQIAENPDAADPATTNMLMSMLNKLSFNAASLRFDDDGITSKIIAFLAAQNDAPPEVMAAGFAAMLPAFAAEAGLPPQMQQQIMEAGSAFLTNPQNLEITITADAPVPFSAFAAAEDDPTAILELVDIAITGNQ